MKSRRPVNSDVRRLLTVMILRAMLGGAIGGFAWLFLPAIFMGADLHALPWLVLGYAFFGLPIGAGIGGLIGFAIWIVYRPSETNLRVVLRVTIGIAIAFVALATYFFLRGGSFGDLTLRHFWYSLIFAFAIGIPSALMARRTATKVPSPAAEQLVGPERRERVS
jgi:hypothetical protein